jgi:hypothetical protein
MKKSNKLLWGGFLTIILMITGIHIALYAKYKNGNYTIFHPKGKSEDERMQSFPNVSFVIVRNVGGATVQLGDRAQVEKRREGFIQYIQKGDSLVITGRDSTDQQDGRRLVTFTLPYNATLSVINSFLYFENNESNAGQLSIITDTLSRLSLPSKHLLKAKITTFPNNP